jgi:hypothetical protein
VAFSIDSRPAYLALFFGNACVTLIAAMIYGFLREPFAVPMTSNQRWADPGYFAAAVYCGLIAVTDTILTIGVPLWIIQYTKAPRILAGLVIGINTLLVVSLQVWAARSANTFDGATRLQRRAAFTTAAACVVLGSAASLGAVGAAAAVVLGVVVLTFAELWTASASWFFRYQLAPDGRQGQYGALFSLGAASRIVLGPYLVALLISGYHFGGWAILSGLFIVLALLSSPVFAWSGSRREIVEAPVS